jgi:hypothetical protein
MSHSFLEFFLRVVKPTRFLPAGVICYCFRDQDGEFWVSTSEDYNSVRQFGFQDKHRDHFKIYGS